MDGVEKHVASNKQRLEAIQRKKKESTKKKASFCGKHTVFDISSDEENEECLVVNSSNDGCHKKMKLFDWDDNLKEEDTFEIKEHFEGQAGEKLFRLQQQIGFDSRFKMDERFLDSEEDMEVERAEEEEEKTDIQEEQEQALRIIDEILGTTSKPLKQLKQATPPSLLLRYDPDSNDCISMERNSPQQVTNEKITPVINLSDVDEEEESTIQESTKSVDVSEEKFYNVNSNLGNLFKVGIDEGNFKFGFTGLEERNKKKRDEMEEEIIDGRPKWIKERFGGASLSDADEGTDENEEEHSPSSSRKPGFLFFFHSNNPELSRLSETSKFYRTESLQDIKEKWWMKRSIVKNSFRKNRREAVKNAQRTGLTIDTNI